MTWIQRGGAFGLALVLCGSCSPGGPSTPETGSQATPRRSGPVGGRGRAPSSPNVNLDSLLTEVPEYQGTGRNLFAYGRQPRAAQPPPTPPVTSTVPPPAPRRPSTRPTPSTPPPARIDLKFAGFVETPHPEGDAKKYAVFLSGEEILTGAEGDLVANRYRIVQIGLESVTVSVEGSGGTQKIPLRTN